jgi:hypothetical protein
MAFLQNLSPKLLPMPGINALEHLEKGISFLERHFALLKDAVKDLA